MLSAKSFTLKESDVKKTSLPVTGGDYLCYVDPFYSGLGDPVCDCLPLVPNYDYDAGSAVKIKAEIPADLMRNRME